MQIRIHIGNSDLNLRPVLADDAKTVREVLTENTISFNDSSFVTLDGRRVMNLDASLASVGAADDSVLSLSQVKNGAKN